MILLVLNPVHADSSFTAYPLQNPVNLDGRYTNANEWSDAGELALGIALITDGAYFSAKYDVNYLYTMWDFVECTTSFNGNDTYGANQVYIYLDPTNKGGGTVDEGMWSILVYTSAGASAWARHGTSTGDWTDWNTHPLGIDARFQYTSSPHSPLTHLVVEIRFALSFAELRSGVQSGSIGASIGFYDGRTDRDGGYPSRWYYKDPSSWGTLEISQVPIPEFSAIAVPFAASLLLIFSVAKLRHHRNTVGP